VRWRSAMRAGLRPAAVSEFSAQSSRIKRAARAGQPESWPSLSGAPGTGSGGQALSLSARRGRAVDVLASAVGDSLRGVGAPGSRRDGPKAGAAAGTAAHLPAGRRRSRIVRERRSHGDDVARLPHLRERRLPGGRSAGLRPAAVFEFSAQSSPIKRAARAGQPERLAFTERGTGTGSGGQALSLSARRGRAAAPRTRRKQRAGPKARPFLARICWEETRSPGPADGPSARRAPARSRRA
jgi:hypothetical protein